MDQIERSVAAIIAAINRVNTSLQRMSTYENIIRLGTAAINEVVSVGGALGFLNVSTVLRGIAAGTTAADGTMKVSKQLAGSSDGAGGADGVFSITRQLAGEVTGQSNLPSVNLQGTSYRMVGNLAASSGSDGNMNVSTQLAGSVNAAWSNCSGNLSV